MIYLSLFFIVIAVSFFLSLRSMSSFQQTPSKDHTYALFLVRNLKALNLETIEKLYKMSLNSKSIFSLEALFKGNQAVLAIYAPESFVAELSELELLEIENYLDSENSTLATNKTIINDVYGWVIAPKNNPKKLLNISQDFLRMIQLDENQKFFWQLVLLSLKNSTNEFQSTIRVMIVESDPIKRVELAKTIDKEIETHTGLVKNPKSAQASSIFESYKKRTLIPKEVTPFVLKKEEVFDLLGKLTH